MELQRHYSLKKENTFRINAYAQYYASFTNAAELEVFVVTGKKENLPLLILGGGSNILFTRDFDGLVLRNEIMGVEPVSEDDEAVYLKAGAGENWHSFVLQVLDLQLGGIENLSLIPGSVGASPIQNIGAYGVELKDSFFELEAYDMKSGDLKTFTGADCAFGYRDSVFKTKYKNRFVILSVTFRLMKSPRINTKYGAIEEELKNSQITNPGIRDVSNAVIKIRQSKLPDPAIIGNAGSFFKNPEISREQFNDLKKQYASIPGYPGANDSVKIAAAWLIEQCGWKGFRQGDAGCHSRQPLVLVNYGNASGAELYDLSTKILSSVENRFGITLEREVNIV